MVRDCAAPLLSAAARRGAAPASQDPDAGPRRPTQGAGPVRRAPLPLHRTAGQSRVRGRRRAGRSEYLLRRGGLGRRLEIDRRRDPLEARLRRAAGAVDRLDRDRSLRSQRRLGRDGRDVHPEPRLARRRHLQIHRRRQDLEADGPREDRADRPRRDRPAQPRPSSSRRRSGPATVRRQERGVYRTTDGGKIVGARPLRGREHGRVGPLDGPEQPARSSLPGLWQIDIKTWGRKSGGPGSGVFRLAGRRNDVEADRPDRACPSRLSARSRSRSRRATPSASTR